MYWDIAFSNEVVENKPIALFAYIFGVCVFNLKVIASNLHFGKDTHTPNRHTHIPHAQTTSIYN